MQWRTIVAMRRRDGREATAAFESAHMGTQVRHPYAGELCPRVCRCSNRGIRQGEGTCKCRDGFTGAACDRMDCPKHDMKYCAGMENA